MSRTASPSHSRRQSGHSFGNNNQSNNHSFRARPSGVPSSSGGGGGRLNAARVPSPAMMNNNTNSTTNQTNYSGGTAGIRNLGHLLGWSVKLKLNETTAGGPNNNSHVSNTAGNNRWVEGKIWCYDPIPGVVILESPGSSKGKANYRMIKVNQVKDLQVGEFLDGNPNPSSAPPSASSTISKILEPVRPINVTAIAMREAQAVKADDARRARIGHGVSRWGQGIFDALGKTLPVRWQQTSIIILDDVMLTGPLYRSEDVRVTGNNQARLSRVKQVLEGEWARLLRTEEGQLLESEARHSSTSTATA